MGALTYVTLDNSEIVDDVITYKDKHAPLITLGHMVAHYRIQEPSDDVLHITYATHVPESWFWRFWQLTHLSKYYREPGCPTTPYDCLSH